jgi:uncharacterized membrane protein YqjE
VVTLLLGLAGVVLVILCGIAATFTLAAFVWENPDRPLILGLASIAYLLGAGVLVWLAARRLKTWRLLEETRRQLRDDRECLQTIVSPTGS